MYSELSALGSTEPGLEPAWAWGLRAAGDSCPVLGGESFSALVQLVFSKIKFASCSLQPRACPSMSAQLKCFRGSWLGFWNQGEMSVPGSTADPGLFQSLETANKSPSPWPSHPPWPASTLQIATEARPGSDPRNPGVPLMEAGAGSKEGFVGAGCLPPRAPHLVTVDELISAFRVGLIPTILGCSIISDGGDRFRCQGPGRAPSPAEIPGIMCHWK